MGVIFQERLGSVYSQSGTAGSASYDLKLRQHGGWYGGPLIVNVNAVAWEGTLVFSTSYNGTVFCRPSVTCVRAGTVGIFPNQYGSGSAAPLTNSGTAWVMTPRAPVNTARVSVSTKDGSVDVTWAALAM
jgi:hypothetical protein